MGMGFRRIAFSGTKAMRGKLAAIAANSGAQFASGRPPRGTLDLLDSPDPASDVAIFLERRRGAKSV